MRPVRRLTEVIQRKGDGGYDQDVELEVIKSDWILYVF